MAITQTGSVLSPEGANTNNTGTASSTITVPADAELVIVGVSCSSGTANLFSGGTVTFTKGAADTAMTLGTATGDGNTGAAMGSIWYLLAPDTGANKSLKWDWAGATASDRFPRFVVTFWKGMNTTTPVRDADGMQSTGAPPWNTPTLTAVSGDVIVGWAFTTSGAEASVDTWSNLTLLTGGQLTQLSDIADGAIASGSPSGNTTVGVATATNMTDGGIVALVLQPAAGATDHSGAATFAGAGSLSAQGTQMTPVTLMGQIVM